MRRRTFVLVAAAPLLRGQEAGLGERAMRHVRYLASLGNRLPGSDGDIKARAYIRQQMERAGLSVTVEPFEYRGFEFVKSELAAGDRKTAPKRLLFDPYSGNTAISGKTAIVEPAGAMRADVAGRIGITSDKANIFQLNHRALAWVQLSTEDFTAWKAAAPERATVHVEGTTRTVRTANVVGSLPARPAADREILITAHMDSVNTPGAQDNASGTSVMLELAAIFGKSKDLPANLRFVAFGAEECGLLGARAFLRRHEAEQPRWKMIFNIDSVGGKDGPYVQMGGTEEAPEMASHKLPLMQDLGPDGNWVYLRRQDFRNYVPAWLEDVINVSSASTGIAIKGSRGMGSDHQAFALAGVPATNIAIGGLPSHTPEDTSDRILPASLEKAARFVEAVVRQAAPNKEAAPA
jgi:Zn-dependent M28 family amino/carboxypeptidase